MFKDWYQRKGFRTLQECADFLDLHKATISRMLSRPGYTPDKFTALHIQRKTRGDIPANSWKQSA